MKYQNIITKIFYVFCTICILAELLFLILPRVVDYNKNKDLINQFSKKIINTEFLYDDLKVKTYPDFTIEINAKNSKLENIATIEDLKLKVGILKLIIGKISVKKLNLNNSTLNIVVNKDGTTNIDNLLQPAPFSLDFYKLNFNITKTDLFLTDEKTSQKIHIKGDSFAGKINKKELETSIKGKIISKSEDSDININLITPTPDIKTGFKNKNKYIILTGYIKNLHTEVFENFIKTFISNDIKKLDGVINAEFKPTYENKALKGIDVNVNLDNLKILSNKKENSVIFNGSNNITAKIALNKENMVLENFNFYGDDYKIKAKGTMKYKTKNPTVNLEINIDNSKAEALYWMLPSTLFTPQEEIKKIKKYGAYAIADGNLKIKGSFYKPEVYGKINFKDVWILDGLGKDVPKAIVKTNFKKDKVEIDVKVWATKTEYVTVVGYSNFFDLSDNEYQINSSKNVPLEVAQKMLPPISDVLGFVIGPVPIMDIKGYGNIDLNAKGSQKNPTLKGYFIFNNASAAFNDIKNLKLENASGKIDFIKDKVYFKNDKGTILNHPAKISGVSDIKVDIDYEAKIEGVSLAELLKTLKTSPMLKDYAKQVKLINNIDGTGDIYLNLKGHLDNPKVIVNPDVIKYIKPYGYINIKNSSVKLENPKTTLHNTNGVINIKDDAVSLNLNSYLYTSALKIEGEIKNNIADFNVVSRNMKLIDSMKFLTEFYLGKTTNLKDISPTTEFYTDIKYKGSVEDINLKGIHLKAIFQDKNNKSQKSKIDVYSGSIDLENGNLKINNLNTKIYNTTAYFNGKIANVFEKPVINANLSLYKFDLSALNHIKTYSIIPQKYRKILNAYKNYNGILSTKLNIKNNNINGNIWLRDISFTHSILDYPFSIPSADFILKNNNIIINNFNASFARTPIFMNGRIDNFIKNPKYNINFSSKLSKEFVDNYINTNISYPINLKGEVLLSSQIKGTKNEINIFPSIKLEEGANVFYMGADIGEENSIREIKGEIQKNKDKLIIKNLDYSKYIYSQNNRLYPLSIVNLSTTISNLKTQPYIENLRLKTNNPIEANIFNALFKKSLVKNGNVMCDIKLEGHINDPKIQGKAQLKNIDIPLYETHIDTVNLNFNNYIDAKAKINYFGSDIDVATKIRNNNFKKLYFENITIHSQKTDLNKLLKVLNEISYKNPIQIVNQGMNNPTSEQTVDLSNIVIEKGTITADNIYYKSLPISNLSSKLSFKNNNFKLENTSIDLAGGKLSGNFGYNLEKALISVDVNTNEVDANELAEAILDIKKQIYGKLNSSIKITTIGADDIERLKNLNGQITFNINDGNMPKLGSLEYLLRAGNLIKSGVSGLTLNNISGLLLPVQNGNFETISGDINIKKGIIEDMKIYSKGKNLSILISGSYEPESSNADLYILGKLSKNIDTILGAVGNASLNSFFNLIPGVHLDENKDTETIKQINSIPELTLPTDKFRIFRVKANGDIYSNSFVRTFEWINK